MERPNQSSAVGDVMDVVQLLTVPELFQLLHELVTELQFRVEVYGVPGAAYSNEHERTPRRR